MTEKDEAKLDAEKPEPQSEWAKILSLQKEDQGLSNEVANVALPNPELPRQIYSWTHHYKGCSQSRVSSITSRHPKLSCPP